jgi:hypothetical protein
VEEDAGFMWKLKCLGLFAIMMVFGLFQGCKDIEYLVSGETTQAQFKEVLTSSGASRRGNTIKSVKFSFIDKKGDRCTGADTVPDEWAPPADGLLDIVYIPGKLELASTNTVARLQGNRSVVGIILFLIGLVGSAVMASMAFRMPDQKRRRR